MANPRQSVIPASKKAGHLAGTVAYGIVSTTVSIGASIVENLFGGLANTGKQVAHAWEELNPPGLQQSVQVQPQPIVPVPPVNQSKKRPATGKAGGQKAAGGNP